jgi:hypothetical protein
MGDNRLVLLIGAVMALLGLRGIWPVGSMSASSDRGEDW